MGEFRVGYEALIFLVSALVGFTAYVVGHWGPVPARQIRTVLTRQRVCVLLVVTALALGIVAIVIATVALPGEWLYTVKSLVRSFAAQAILGCVFGFGLAIWLDYLIRTAAPVGAQTGVAHKLWGIALIVLFLGGILMGPANRLVPRLTGISTPAVSVTFGESGHSTEPPVATAAGKSSGRGRVTGLSKGYVLLLKTYFQYDKAYVRLLHGKYPKELSELHKKAFDFLQPIVDCVAEAMNRKKAWDDSGTVHEELGPALVAGTAWLRSVLEENDMGKAQKRRGLLSLMYSRLPSCKNHPQAPKESRLLKEAYELPYFALTLAHLMQLAGYGDIGADLLAKWIDRSRQEDLAEKISDWYRLRTYIHLSTLVGAGGDSVVSHAVLVQSVELFKDTFHASSVPALQDRDSWGKDCTRRTDEDNYVFRLRFTLMTQSSRLIREAIYSGQATAALLRYAQGNIAVPMSCYPVNLPEPDQWRADFLTTGGALLVALDARARATLSAKDDDLKAYRDARAYLVRALALLRPLEEIRNTHRFSGASAAIQKHPVHDEILETERYLRRAERGLGMR